MTCADCDAELVFELPEEHPDVIDLGEYEKTLTHLDSSDIAIVKSLLDSASTDCYPRGFPSMYVAHDLMVLKGQVSEAKDTLKDVEREHYRIKAPKEWAEE